MEFCPSHSYQSISDSAHSHNSINGVIDAGVESTFKMEQV